MKTNGGAQAELERTAGEAGWHVSRYNLYAKVPGTEMIAVANLFKGTCAELTPVEACLLPVIEELGENHPVIDRLARRAGGPALR
jgi:uncharacterized protein